MWFFFCQPLFSELSQYLILPRSVFCLMRGPTMFVRLPIWLSLGKLAPKPEDARIPYKN